MNLENALGNHTRDLELALTLEPDVASQDADAPHLNVWLRSSRC